MATPLRKHKGAQARLDAKLGIILGLFAERNNLTFDTANEIAGAKDRHTKGRIGFAELAVSVFCADKSCLIFRLPLNGITHYSTLMSSELPPSSSHTLRSLRMPIDLTVGFVLLGSTACTCGLFYVADSKRLGMTVSILITSRALLQQAPSVQSQRKLVLTIFIAWLLCTTFVGIVFTSLLQSVVVVPVIHVSELSFDQMVRQNFEFYSWPRTAKTIRKFAHYSNRTLVHTSKTHSAPRKHLEFLSRETVLGEKIKTALSEDVWSPGFLSSSSKKSRTVLVGLKVPIMACAQVMKSRGFNAAVGRERLFESHYHWNFMTEKPARLIETLELMKAAGFVHKFQKQIEIELHADSFYKMYEHKEYEAREEVAAGVLHENGIASEGMFVFMYGIALSVTGWVCEVVAFYVEILVS